MKSLHSALRLRLSASARLGNEPVTASYHIYSGTESGKAGEVSTEKGKSPADEKSPAGQMFRF